MRVGVTNATLGEDLFRVRSTVLIGPVQSLMRATLQNEDLVWSGKLITLALRRFNQKLTEGVFILSTQEYAKELKKMSEEKLKRDAAKM